MSRSMMFEVLANGRMVTAADLHAHGYPELADTMPRDGRAAYHVPYYAHQLAVRMRREFPEDRITVQKAARR